MIGEILKEKKIEISVADHIKLIVDSYVQPVLAMDTTGCILDCNSDFLSIYGFEKEIISEKNYFDFFTTHNLALPSESVQELLGKKSNNITLHRVNASRSIKYYQWTGFSLKLSSNIEIIFLLAHDVTSILEIAIKEQLLVDSLIDSLPAQIFWKDKSLVYLGCNKGFLKSLGLEDKSEIIGKTDFDLPVNIKQSKMFREDDFQVITSINSKLNIEERQTLDDGSERVLSTSKVPLFDDQGEVYGVLGVYRDITEQKRSETELKEAMSLAEQANYTKSEFIANMSHDIRTPLSGVVGMSQLLVDILVDTEHKQHAQWIHECGVQLLGLLNDILTVVAEDNVNDSDTKNDVFSLRQCVEDIIHLERPSTAMKGIELSVHIEDDISDLLIGDRAGLHRILLNLLGNAIKFTSIGSVRVEIKKLKQYPGKVELQFSVKDTGIGIPEELRSRVFDRFYRANPSYKGVYSGHGIGLHIAQSYVKRLGGDLQFTSKVDFGTNFFFDLTFDLAENDNLDILSLKSDMNAPSPIKAFAEDKDLPIVLLVEDNYVALKVLESIVKLVNLRFVSANDGESALEIAKTQNFQLIITDIGLPGISGNELASKIRAWEVEHDKSPTPIIGLTAHVRDQIREECIQQGMSDAYSKPMDLATMKEIINRFVY
jgi:PAS domain S-box-containing protein